ncbi:MAG: glutathione S-transferase [Methylophilales bacterium]|nr:glutathione S-transferase [Methylophilales bacterium]
MSKPALYSYRRCPYAMRARIALRYAGIEVEIREISLREKPPEMLAASPKGTVPVLILGDKVLDESLDIMRWALTQNDPDDWLSQDDAELIAENDGSFKGALDRYKYAVRFPGHPPESYRAEGQVFLAKLEQRLERHAYLSSDTPCMADIAIFPFIRQFAGVDSAWFETAPYPCLRAWLNGLVGGKLFLSVMEKPG